MEKEGVFDNMIEIEKPKIERVDLTDTYGEFVIEPLERGYGTTIGNSLRRILLSSLPGTAVTSVFIEGVLHEFSTIPGVVEDVVDIVLTLKKLLVRMHTDEPVHIRVEARDAGIVWARDIVTDPDVEILNPDLPIATLQEGAVLNMEIKVERGRGYVPAERNKAEGHPIGLIPVDSIFTPVLKVNYEVVPTRVGQVADYDKLTLQVWTDGTINPNDAVGLASRIMVEHMRLFTDLREEPDIVEILVEKEEENMDRLLEMTVEDLDMSVRSFNCLKRAGIDSVAQLTQRSEEDMMRVRNLGKKSLQEVREKLASLGLSLRQSDE